MIIDCHGHYTTVPKAHSDWRQAQKAAFKANGSLGPAYPGLSDDQIRETIEANQLKVLKERGADLTIFSPRASAMEPHVGNEDVVKVWARQSNDLIKRVVDLFPANFVGVCQLPQGPEMSIAHSVEELQRCVVELGFVGCNLNPDPSGAKFSAPPLYDRAWYPLFEKMVELDVPAMIHVSGSCNPAMHATGAYYIAADTMAFVQLIEGDLFRDFPELRLIIPHGGGAVPYQWGRYRSISDGMGKSSLKMHVMKNVFFDTCVYDQPAIDFLFKVIDADNILFGSEMFGVANSIDQETGYYYDDTKRYIDNIALPDSDRRKVFETNARRVYPRLDAQLRARGL